MARAKSTASYLLTVTNVHGERIFSVNGSLLHVLEVFAETNYSCEPDNYHRIRRELVATGGAYSRYYRTLHADALPVQLTIIAETLLPASAPAPARDYHEITRPPFEVPAYIEAALTAIIAPAVAAPSPRTSADVSRELGDYYRVKFKITDFGGKTFKFDETRLAHSKEDATRYFMNEHRLSIEGGRFALLSVTKARFK